MGATTKPQVTALDKHFLGAEQGITTPNGVRVAGNHVFVSNNSSAYRFTLDDNGQLIDSQQVISGADGIAIIDDIMPYCDGLAVTDYLLGRLLYFRHQVDAQGNESFNKVYETAPFGFSFPSAIAIGQPPFFSGDQLLITEKGILQDTTSTTGNKLTSARLSLDLNDPTVCEVIREG
ncbi:MAG: hypothetical protein LAT63_15365 [Marinobacter sp.]|nr:hypothetical protein [Marinobacter sp.]